MFLWVDFTFSRCYLGVDFTFFLVSRDVRCSVVIFFLCDNLKKYCTYDEFLRTCGFPLLL